MTQSPPRWTEEELEEGAAAAEGSFRSLRLTPTEDWERHYREARAKFQELFASTGDLDPSRLDAKAVALAASKKLGESLRYLAGPPVSDDDLKVIADVTSLAPGTLGKDLKSAQKVFDVIRRIIDPHRFPWIEKGMPPTKEERDAALLASSVLLAAQRIATQRRADGKTGQEGKVKAYLESLGLKEVPPKPISTIVHGPGEGEFCGECMLQERKADVVVRLRDTRLLAIECKVSNSSTNSVKRLNNDAAVKAVYWIKQFGEAQVVPAAVLGGVFKVMNLVQAQERGLTLFWEHDLDKLGQFIMAT